MSRNRFLLDQMLDADVAVAMVEAGYDAIRVSEIGMARAEDDAILGRALWRLGRPASEETSGGYTH